MAAGLAVAALGSPARAEDDPRFNAIAEQFRALQSELARVSRELADTKSELRATRQARSRPEAPVASAPRAQPPGGAQQAASTANRDRIDSNGPPSSLSPPASNAPRVQPPGPASPASTANRDRIDSNGPPSSVSPPADNAPSAPPNPGGLSFPRGRPTLTSPDGQLSVALGLQLGFDAGGYFQGSRRGLDTRQFPRLNTFGENLRRAYIPFVFRYDTFQVNITPDFGGSPDGSPTLYEANLNWQPSMIRPLTATVGYFKPWQTLGDSESSNDFLFLERPSIVEAARSIAASNGRASAGARWATDRYFVASYLTGSLYGSQVAAAAQPQQTGATLRLAGRPVATPDWDVHTGFSASDAFHIQRSAAGQTLTVSDRPELRIDNNRLVSTGALNARSAYTYGPEFALRWRNFMLQGEYIRVGVDRTNGGAVVRTPGLEFDGGYAEASWVITGEPRRYLPSSAAFGNPAPARQFSLRDGGYGAFELVGRYSHINLNDRVTRGRSAASTGGVYGGIQDIYAVGVNWYLDDHLRILFDYDIINVDHLNPAGTTQIGQRIQAVALRAQATF